MLNSYRNSSAWTSSTWAGLVVNGLHISARGSVVNGVHVCFLNILNNGLNIADGLSSLADDVRVQVSFADPHGKGPVRVVSEANANVSLFHFATASLSVQFRQLQAVHVFKASEEVHLVVIFVVSVGNGVLDVQSVGADTDVVCDVGWFETAGQEASAGESTVVGGCGGEVVKEDLSLDAEVVGEANFVGFLEVDGDRLEQRTGAVREEFAEEGVDTFAFVFEGGSNSEATRSAVNIESAPCGLAASSEAVVGAGGHYSSAVHLSEEPAVNQLYVFDIRLESVVVVGEDGDEAAIGDDKTTLVVFEVADDEEVVDTESDDRQNPVPYGDTGSVGGCIKNSFLTSKLEVCGVEANGSVVLVKQRQVLILQFNNSLADGTAENSLAWVDIVKVLQESENVLG